MIQIVKVFALMIVLGFTLGGCGLLHCGGGVANGYGSGGCKAGVPI